jgi:Trk K+ transport system NAD-binding subunit
VGAPPRALHDHVVVCGLGNVGYRTVTELMAQGIGDVVAVEIDEEGRYVDPARRLGVPVIIGDATLPETLAAVRITEARCLVVATNDDEANLQMALNARAEHPAMRIVLRLFDPDQAVRIERAFGLRLSRSVSALAAPAFVSAALGPRILASIPFEENLLLVAEAAVAPGAAASGATVAALEELIGGRVLLMERADASRWGPSPGEPVAAGDVVVAAIDPARLERLVDITARPR